MLMPFIQHKIEALGFDFLDDDTVISLTIPRHSHQFAPATDAPRRLAKVANLTLHALILAILSSRSLAMARFLVGAQCRGLKLLVQIIDFVERFFVSFGPVVVFLF